MNTNTLLRHRPRISKGYRYVYSPNSQSASESESYRGFIFEHRLIAEQKLGRALNSNETVHHIDGNKLNNDPNNLIVLSNADHSMLHKLLQKGLGIECLKDAHEKRVCIDCGKQLAVSKYSSSKIQRCPVCTAFTKRKTVRPSSDALLKDVNEHAYTTLEKKYGVSTAAIKKWLRSYGITPPDKRENYIRDKPYVITEAMRKSWEANRGSDPRIHRKWRDAVERRIVQEDINGNIIMSYQSAASIERTNPNLKASPIIRCCRGKSKIYKGFVWKYYQPDKSNP